MYKNGIDVIFVTEPYTVSKANSLLDVPDNVFNVFAERGGRTALVTKGMNTWKVLNIYRRNLVSILNQIKIKQGSIFLWKAQNMTGWSMPVMIQYM